MSDDPFALLDLPRRPWLEPTVLRAAFQARARECHPDAPCGDAVRFTALNAAQAALSDPAQRLSLLAWPSPPHSMPRNAALGFRVGSGVREAAALIARREGARSPLERALADSDAAASRKSLALLDREIADEWMRAETTLREWDALWPDVAASDLAALAAEFRFLARWRSQLRERMLALSL